MQRLLHNHNKKVEKKKGIDHGIYEISVFYSFRLF